MLEVQTTEPEARSVTSEKTLRVAVIWIDWYAYHIARFRALVEHQSLSGKVIGIEMVGGVGVHAGLKFREDIPDALPVETLFPGSNWTDAKGTKAAIAVWKALNRLNPAVVLVPGYYTMAGLAAAVWCKLNRRRAILMTESAQQDHSRVWWKEAFKGFIIRSLFDWAVSGGVAHRRYLKELGFANNRIGCFYDVIDNDFFAERANALRTHCSPNDFDLPHKYFLYVGRLAEEKNIDGLIRAYAQYRSEGGSWSLVLVGDGPCRPGAKKIADSNRFGSDIHFAGLKSTSELPQYYAFAGCFVLPSIREPWGLVANEAMASGLPVIVSSRCGCAEDLVRDGVNGFIFDPSHPGSLATCLRRISEFPEAQMTRFRNESRQIISRYSPSNWASEVARIAGC